MEGKVLRFLSGVLETLTISEAFRNDGAAPANWKVRTVEDLKK
jgi:hypothetical protein